MPGDDGILRVTSVFDGSSLASGMTEAAASVKINTSKISADFSAAGRAAKIAQAQLAEFQASIRGDATAAQTAVLEDLNASVDATAAAYKNAAIAAIENASAIKSANQTITGSMMQTRAGAQLLSRDLGLGIPRGLMTIAARSETLGPLLSAAFPVIVVASFIEILGKLPGAIEKISNEIQGWNEDAKRAFMEADRESESMVRTLHKIAEEEVVLRNTAGLTGLAKTAGEIKAIQENVAQATKEQHHYVSELQATGAEYDSLKLKASDWLAIFNPTSASGVLSIAKLFMGQERDINKQHQEDAKRDAAELETEQVEAQQRLRNAQAQAASEAATNQREAAKTSITNAKNYQDAVLDTHEKGYKELLKTAEISEAQEVRDLIQASNEKLAVERKYVEDSKALNFREQRQTGKPAGPENATLDNDLKIAQIKNIEEIAAIKARAAEDEVRRAAKTNEEIIKLSEEMNREFAKQAEENQRQNDKEFEERFRAAKKAYDDERRAAIEAMNETLSYNKQTTDRQLEATIRADNERLAHSAITRRTWVSGETAAVEEWYSKQRAVLDQALVEARLIYGEQASEYKKLQDKLEELDQQRRLKEKEIDNQQLNDFRTMANQMTASLSTGINQWLTHGKSFGAAMRQTWSSLAMDVIQDIEKMGEKWIAEHLLMAAVQKLLGGSGSSDQVAKTTASNVAQAQSDAGLAAAAAFSSTMAGLPFPANIVAAPIAGETALAQGEVYVGMAGFEQGGISPIDQIAQIHKNEMILPSPISSMVQSMAQDRSGRPAGAAGLTVHYAPTIHNNGGNTADFAAMLSKHADHLGRIIKNQGHRFNR